MAYNELCAIWEKPHFRNKWIPSTCPHRAVRRASFSNKPISPQRLKHAQLGDPCGIRSQTTESACCLRHVVPGFRGPRLGAANCAVLVQKCEPQSIVLLQNNLGWEWVSRGSCYLFPETQIMTRHSATQGLQIPPFLQTVWQKVWVRPRSRWAFLRCKRCPPPPPSPGSLQVQCNRYEFQLGLLSWIILRQGARS